MFKKKSVYFEAGYLETSIYDIEDIQINDRINGPAIIIDKNR
jgi:5-oxoprolinase (ATP-hydrolysing)